MQQHENMLQTAISVNSGQSIMQRKHVLAVDDEEMTRDVLVQALRILGYNANTAENGRVALDIAKKQKPDLIITDIYMPEMNGIELLQQIRQIYGSLPVILITGFDADEAREAADTYNASALLMKPFRINQLKKLIEETIG